MRNLYLGATLSLILVTLTGCSTNKPVVDTNLPNVLALRTAVVEVLVNGQIKGTGAFISEDGLVLTASHLFENDTVTVEIITSDKQRYSGLLLRRHRAADLALVQVEVGDSIVNHFSIAKEMPKHGEPVLLYGAALWNPIMLLTGQMANPNDNYCEYSTSNGYMQTAFVNASTPGLVSGGPWINLDGQIFGVQAGHLLDKGHDAGISMVGQLSSIKKLLASKRSIHTAGVQAWLWPLWTSDRGLVDSYPGGTSGLIVNKLFNNSVLGKAGVKKHEVILSCNGKPTPRRGDFFSIIRSIEPGDRVTLKVMGKNHKTRTVQLILGDIEGGTL